MCDYYLIPLLANTIAIIASNSRTHQFIILLVSIIYYANDGLLRIHFDLVQCIIPTCIVANQAVILRLIWHHYSVPASGSHTLYPQ